MATQEIGGIYVRDMYLGKAGEVIEGHSHTFDHCSMCIYGKARVDPMDFEDGKWVVKPERGAVYAAPQHATTIGEVAWCNIPKGVRHQITCLMDGTYFWCVYPRDKAN